MVRLIFISLLICFPAFAQDFDPYDPFSVYAEEQEAIKDEDKPSELLIFEAGNLEYEGRLLDSRSKLLLALKKDPDSILAHLMLSDYYYRHVGHFRLVLKYVLKAQEIFEKTYGKPAYSAQATRRLHGELLRRLAEARLNLDDYQGALDVLESYLAEGYSSTEVVGSKAWILMKLNRLDDAIAVARSAMNDPTDLGRIMNVLGILLSMKGQREEAIEIFEKAYRNELSLGGMGSPATPLNNVGEVYRELFREEKAKRSWLKSVSLPDGCEHVLPSLNLATINIEAAEFSSANEAMNNFENCIAQYPLRNGEEHRALVALIRSRVAIQTGSIDLGLKLIDESLRKTQWFGRIGSSEDDLKSAVYSSYAYALNVKNNRLKKHASKSILENLSIKKTILLNSLRAWWYKRKALRILSRLRHFEDIYPRHTDSLLDYPVLGSLLKMIPNSILKNRIIREQESDTREQAKLYYSAYEAENLLASSRKRAIEQIKSLIKQSRLQDLQLKIHLSALLATYSADENEKLQTLEWIYKNSPSALANYGLELPVNSSGMDDEVKSKLSKYGYLIKNNQNLNYIISYRMNANEHQLSINTNKGSIIAQTSADNLEDCINKLNDLVFKQEI